MSVAPALTREQLDAQRCGDPVCTHDHSVLFLAAGCHPAAGLSVSYEKRTGRLKVQCQLCDAPVATIAVARSELAQ